MRVSIKFRADAGTHALHTQHKQKHNTPHTWVALALAALRPDRAHVRIVVLAPVGRRRARRHEDDALHLLTPLARRRVVRDVDPLFFCLFWLLLYFCEWRGCCCCFSVGKQQASSNCARRTRPTKTHKQTHHFVADHFSPVMTGHEPCRLAGSNVPSGRMLQNSTASPFFGLTAKPCIAHSENPSSLVCPSGTGTFGNTVSPPEVTSVKYISTVARRLPPLSSRPFFVVFLGGGLRACVRGVFASQSLSPPPPLLPSLPSPPHP